MSSATTHTNPSMPTLKREPYTEDERFPLYYNTTAGVFGVNRERSRALRKQKRKVIMERFNKLHKQPAPAKLPSTSSGLSLPLASPGTPKADSGTSLPSTYSTPLAPSTNVDLLPLSELSLTPNIHPSTPQIGTGASLPQATPVPAPAPAAKPKKWSDMFTVNTPTLPTVDVAPGLQSLGLVVLRAMYEPNYTVSSTPTPIYPHGIMNTGNVCFMNVTLQVLLYCEPFHAILRVIAQKTMAAMANSKTPLLDATIAFLTQFEKPAGAGLSVNPEQFYKALIATSRFKHLRWGQQEDAEEFLGYLLDGLHEEFVESIGCMGGDERARLLASVLGEVRAKMASALATISRGSALDVPYQGGASEEREVSEDDDDGWHEVGSKKKVAVKRTVEVRPSPITVVFGGQFRSVLDIPKNKEAQSITLDPFQHFQLDISDPRAHTLEDCFKQLSVPELIPYRSSTNQEVMAQKQCFLDSLPQVFIIHLKRFQYFPDDSAQTESYGRVEKLRKTIKYSEHLQIPTECLSNYYKKHQKQASLDNNYRLIGVVYHHGSSAAGGHYTADVMMPNRHNWIRIDDTNVLRLDGADVVTQGPADGIKSSYILMYQRV